MRIFLCINNVEFCNKIGAVQKFMILSLPDPFFWEVKGVFSCSNAPPMFSSSAPPMFSCSNAHPMFSYSKAHPMFSSSNAPSMFVERVTSMAIC